MSDESQNKRKTEEDVAPKAQFIYPDKAADEVPQAEPEFQKKYGFPKKPIIPRNISSGGKQYFDSDEHWNKMKSKDVAPKALFLNPDKADGVSQGEFQKKYGFVKKPVTPRKISSGGKQYFDSGDYNMEASKTHRKEIAAHPRAMNPQMAQMRMKATITKTQPSKLTSSQGSPPALASRVARASPLAQ